MRAPLTLGPCLVVAATTAGCGLLTGVDWDRVTVAGDGGSSGTSGIDADSRKPDGGTDGPASIGARPACGSTFCRSDQRCVSNACTYDCTGTKVPGAYPNITEAATALAAIDADATICLGAIEAGEVVTIYASQSFKRKLSVIATVPSLANLGNVTVDGGYSELTLVGFSVTGRMMVGGRAKVTLRGLRLSGPDFVLQVSGAPPTPTIVIDGCDIGSKGASSFGVYVNASATTTFNVTIMNSYIHGGEYGVYLYGANGPLALDLVNNTIDKVQNGLHLTASSLANVSYTNNIVSNAKVGVTLGGTMTATHSNNALFNNAADYAGTAVEGTDYVRADCQLELAGGILQTRAGSPCRGVGKPGGAPAMDFWNAPRGAKIDLGAVQGP